METDKEQAFKQVKAFTTQSEYFGIPADVFYGIVGMSIAIGAVLRSPLIIMVYLVVLGVPMYHIHRSDPHALKIWIRAVKRRHTRWCSGVATPRELIILRKEDKR